MDYLIRLAVIWVLEHTDRFVEVGLVIGWSMVAVGVAGLIVGLCFKIDREETEW